MECSQSLSVESFSFKWVINLKPSFEGLDDSLRASLDLEAYGGGYDDEAAFIDMDPKLAFSRRRYVIDAQDFNFPTCQSPPLLVHADEVFSNGLLVPYFLSPSKVAPISSPRFVRPTNHSRHRRSSFLRRCLKSWRIVVKKHLCFLKPLSQKVRDSNMGNTTTRAETSNAYMLQQVVDTDCCIGDWSDIENSIQDAVLHCRKSFERCIDGDKLEAQRKSKEHSWREMK